jgi:predicted dehydrogenase
MTVTSDATLRTYKVAILSNAMHQERFGPALAAHPRLELVCVVDEPGQEAYVAERNRSLAESLGVPLIETDDVGAALLEAGVDVVSVAPQIERRGKLGLAAARAGMQLWLDKPPAPSLVETETIAAEVASRGLTCMVFSHLAAPWSRALQAAVLGGELGTLRALHLDFDFIKGDAAGLTKRRVPSGTGPRGAWTFRAADPTTDPTESGHNVAAKREMAEEGWYALSLAWRLSPRPVQRVYATTGAYFSPHHRDHNVEDFATLVITLEDGPVVTISTGRTGRATHPGGGRMVVRAVGERGTVAVDGGQPPALTYYGDPGTSGPGLARPRNRPTGDSTGLADLVDHFVDCLDGKATPISGAADAVQMMRIMEAAYESAATGQPVNLP